MPNKGFDLLVAGQFATRLQEFGLRSSYLDGSWQATPSITTFLSVHSIIPVSIYPSLINSWSWLWYSNIWKYDKFDIRLYRYVLSKLNFGFLDISDQTPPSFLIHKSCPYTHINQCLMTIRKQLLSYFRPTTNFYVWDRKCSLNYRK